MFFIEKTPEFDKWLKKLKDLKAKAIILFRIQKLEEDEHFGDCEPVGDGIRELKVNFAKGYRVYFKEKDGKIIVLLMVKINRLNKGTLRKLKKFGKS